MVVVVMMKALNKGKRGLMLVVTACAAALYVSQVSNTGGGPSPPRSQLILPAVPNDQHDPLLEACDMSQGLHMGYRSDARREYTFFTFDPTKDRHVSAGMISTGGLYDAHVHAALDVSLKALASQGIMCNRDNVVLDVGSNLGTLALYSASLGCPTHAFEIQPAVACRLQMSIRANALDVTLHRNAVHSVAGKTFTFPSLPSNPGGVGISGEASDGTASLTVTSVRLDDLFASSEGGVLFMKIDTEGNEFEVLKSADGLLSAHKIHNFVVEVRQHQTDMVEFVYSHGYTCALIRETQILDKTQGDITCRGRTVAQVSADVKGIEPDGFSDMFCCVA
mmetsp:Transcript_2452/g.3864  ORF Transcript_2452/g.3864 Transcript_2452/m.3864 type:complete len:336 (+) Transcript_2452:219-1226(+)